MSSSSYVIHVPVGDDVSDYVFKALSTKDVKKRRIDTNQNQVHASYAVDISTTKNGSTSVSVRDHIVSRYRGDIHRIVKYELMPHLIKCT